MFRTATFDRRASTLRLGASLLELRAASFKLRRSTFKLRASPLNLRASTFELRASPFELRASPLNLRASTFELRASPLNLRASTFELRASTFELRASTFELRASAFELERHPPTSQPRVTKPSNGGTLVPSEFRVKRFFGIAPLSRKATKNKQSKGRNRTGRFDEIDQTKPPVGLNSICFHWN
jgi:hypothetical protein